jgi:hypothetical protein
MAALVDEGMVSWIMMSGYGEECTAMYQNQSGITFT